VRTEPVAMCRTDEVCYWTHGWVDKRKFRGALLSAASWPSSLEGEEEPDTIIRGKVHHGWVLTVAGDTSGCGWDATIHFLHEPLAEGTETFEDTYDADGNEVPAPIIDGPHEATWWEAS